MNPFLKFGTPLSDLQPGFATFGLGGDNFSGTGREKSSQGEPWQDFFFP
jgi:hypothetical protein